MGLDLTSLAVFAGAVGVGVGLGLQGIIKDFASGVSLVFERLVAVGDFVELPNGGRGVVHEIGPRATRIRTNDSTDIIVPNSVLVNDQVINWTLRNTNRRIRVPFVTAFGADKNKVREAVLKAAKAGALHLARRRRAQGPGLAGGLWRERALKFELVVWPTVEAVRRPAAIFAAYTWADRRRPARGGDRGALSAARHPAARPVRRGGRRRPDAALQAWSPAAVAARPRPRWPSRDLQATTPPPTSSARIRTRCPNRRPRRRPRLNGDNLDGHVAAQQCLSRAQ
jgi:hypothetical protein